MTTKPGANSLGKLEARIAVLEVRQRFTQEQQDVLAARLKLQELDMHLLSAGQSNWLKMLLEVDTRPWWRFPWRTP